MPCVLCNEYELDFGQGNNFANETALFNINA